MSVLRLQHSALPSATTANNALIRGSVRDYDAEITACIAVYTMMRIEALPLWCKSRRGGTEVSVKIACDGEENEASVWKVALMAER